MRNPQGRRKPVLRSVRRLVASFMLAVMADGSLHHHETHSPHTNRREVAEEQRRRSSETQRSRMAQRSLNAGPGPSEEDEYLRQLAALAVRRDSGRFPPFSG